MRFHLLQTLGPARLGRLETCHGIVETPAFMPVGTLGAVKGLTPQMLEELGGEILLTNLYHLSLRPGFEVLEGLGGIHRFTGWRGPILTDSGGFQVFSLEGFRQLDSEGVTFRSHLDGSLRRWTPEGVVAAQERLGVDVAMVLDDCPPFPASPERLETAVARTCSWAKRSLEVWQERERMGLFGILQGGVDLEVRGRCAEQLVEMDFAGFAIGGVSVGEPEPLRRKVVEFAVPLLPDDRPRYLMGVGTPADLWHAVASGVDLFDCVLPARNGRHGLLYTRQGVIRIKNARYRTDPGPIDTACSCPVCCRVPRALVHHLFRSGELTAAVYGTIHNLRFFLDFVGELRKAIKTRGSSDPRGVAEPKLLEVPREFQEACSSGNSG